MNELIFPNSSSYEKDSLFVELKDEFCRNDTYNYIYSEFFKLKNESFFKTLINKNVLFNKIYDNFYWFVNISAFIIAAFSFIIAFLFHIKDINLSEFMLISISSLTFYFLLLSFFLKDNASFLSEYYNYAVLLRSFPSVMEDFFNKKLSISQLEKLKREITKEHFISMLNYNNNCINYRTALIALHENKKGSLKIKKEELSNKIYEQI